MSTISQSTRWSLVIAEYTRIVTTRKYLTDAYIFSIISDQRRMASPLSSSWSNRYENRVRSAAIRGVDVSFTFPSFVGPRVRDATRNRNYQGQTVRCNDSHCFGDNSRALPFFRASADPEGRRQVVRRAVSNGLREEIQNLERPPSNWTIASV